MGYFNNFLVFVIFTVSLSCELGSVSNVSGGPPDIQFLTSDYRGNQNIEITFTLKFLESTEYTLNRIEWDLDGDKVIDSIYSFSGNDLVIDSLKTFTCKYKYIEAGVYKPFVRIVYNENEAVSTPMLMYTYYTDSKEKLTYVNSIVIEE